MSTRKEDMPSLNIKSSVSSKAASGSAGFVPSPMTPQTPVIERSSSLSDSSASLQLSGQVSDPIRLYAEYLFQINLHTQLNHQTLQGIEPTAANLAISLANLSTLYQIFPLLQLSIMSKNVEIFSLKNRIMELETIILMYKKQQEELVSQLVQICIFT